MHPRAKLRFWSHKCKNIPKLTNHQIARFWSQVDVGSKTECWEWRTGLTDTGYGQTTFNFKTYRAHRVAYTFFYGAIREGYTLDHLCKNRKCVNPNHLEVVSSYENMLRSDTSLINNYKKTHCKRGHAYSGKNLSLIKGHRLCRACMRMNSAKYRLKKLNGESLK